MSAKVAIVAGGGGATGRATVLALAATCLTVVAVDGSEAGLRDLPDGVRLEVADTTPSNCGSCPTSTWRLCCG